MGVAGAIASTKNAVLSERGKDGFKKSFRHECLVAQYAVVDPVLLDTSGPLVEAALSGMEDVWQRPVRVREGGSIPIVSTFSKVLRVPVLLLGFGLPDDRLHSPNEKFSLNNFYIGIKTVARFLAEYGQTA